MRNRMYGGVRGRKTKVGEKLLRFPPTRFFLFILSEYLIHDYSNGAIAGYIAGGAETVHRNIEGYHKRLHISIET